MLNTLAVIEYNSQLNAYGFGTVIRNALIANFPFEPEDKEKQPIAERGKKSAPKAVGRCEHCFSTKVAPADANIKSASAAVKQCHSSGLSRSKEY